MPYKGKPHYMSTMCMHNLTTVQHLYLKAHTAPLLSEYQSYMLICVVGAEDNTENAQGPLILTKMDLNPSMDK